MKIALSVWNNYISNVFDFSHSFLLAEVQDGLISDKTEVSLPWQSELHRLCRLKEMGVELIICGAISRRLMNMLDSCGIKVLPFVNGSVNDVLEAFVSGKLDQPEFVMPASWPGARRGFGRRQRQMRCCNRRTDNKKL